MHATDRRRWTGHLALLSAILAGCSAVPASRLDECRNRSQALQAEALRLKDETLRLRSKNRELARRAVEDAERLRELEASIEPLRESVVAYQRERDELAEAFDTMTRELRTAAEEGPEPGLRR